MIREKECWSGLLLEIVFLGRSRQEPESEVYFRFQPEQDPASTLRSVQEAIQFSRDLLEFLQFCLLSNRLELIETYFRTSVVI